MTRLSPRKRLKFRKYSRSNEGDLGLVDLNLRLLTLHYRGHASVAAAAKLSDDQMCALAPPRHVAIIMDGNGRWAKERGLPRTLGHRQGVEAVRRAVRTAIELKITFLTIFSFSSENWKRPADEVDDLMGLMKRFIRRDLVELHEAGVCIRVIGQRQHVDSELTKLIDEAVELTKGNERLTLVIAFNYGSRSEIAGAARKLAVEVAAGKLDPSAITVERMANALDTSGIPDPDLLIRTSGEMRLSNFLLWQTAYSEFVFLDCYWPDFDKAAFEGAIGEFRSRERRFGGLTQRSTA